MHQLEVRTKQYLLTISSYDAEAMFADAGESVPGILGAAAAGAGEAVDDGLVLTGAV